MQNTNKYLSVTPPGLKIRINVTAFNDLFGLPAHRDSIATLVLSHEALENGILLGSIRKKKGTKELRLMHSKQTEGSAMISVTLMQ